MVPQVAVYPTVELTRGADFYDTIIVKSPETGEIEDLTGYTFRWQFRSDRSPTSTLLADIGVTVGTSLDITPEDGVIYAHIPGSITADFPESVWHDLLVDYPSPASIRLFWWRGQITMSDGITQL